MAKQATMSLHATINNRLTMSFGERLSVARNRHGYTQEGLAEAIGVKRSSLAAWERDTSFPLVPNLLKLCHLLQMTPNDLLADEITFGDTNNIPFMDLAEVVIRKNTEVMLQLVRMVSDFQGGEASPGGNQSGKSPEKE